MTENGTPIDVTLEQPRILVESSAGAVRHIAQRQAAQARIDQARKRSTNGGLE